MKFLVDANLPPGLAVWLREQGHQATHVCDTPGNRADDEEISRFALRTGSVIVTKDEDFALRAVLASEHASVVWLRLGNATNSQLRRWLEPLLPEIVRRLQAGEKLIEVV